jgi:hypothetical protein
LVTLSNIDNLVDNITKRSEWGKIRTIIDEDDFPIISTEGQTENAIDATSEHFIIDVVCGDDETDLRL